MPGAGATGMAVSTVGNEVGKNSYAPISGTPVVKVVGLGLLLKS